MPASDEAARSGGKGRLLSCAALASLLATPPNVELARMLSTIIPKQIVYFV